MLGEAAGGREGEEGGGGGRGIHTVYQVEGEPVPHGVHSTWEKPSNTEVNHTS